MYLNLGEAAAQLKHIVDRVDNLTNEELETELYVPPFRTAIVGFQDECEARIQLLGMLETEAVRLKALASKIRAKADSLELHREALKQSTVEIISANPELSFDGHTGTLKLHKNGGKAPVEWRTTTRPETLKRVLPADPATFEIYPHAWLEMKTVCILKDGFEDAVRSGRVHSKAASVLERGQHLKVT